MSEETPLDELRLQWEALANADTLHMLPTEALIASIKDLSNTLLELTAKTSLAHDLAEAIRLTVEYVGNDMLPAKSGWSWFDALNRYNPDMVRPFIEKPIHFAPGSKRWSHPQALNEYKKEEMFVDPRTWESINSISVNREFAQVSVVTCTRCGSLVVDTELHEQMHLKHGHAGFGFENNWS